ncbi:MAG TPA: FemAB, partial [Novosphingobium sp.]
MNAPYFPTAPLLRLIDPADPRIAPFLAECPRATVFHQPEWLSAVTEGTGNHALVLAAERDGGLVGYLPLHEIHSPIFGRLLASTGFAVGGGLLLAPGTDPAPLLRAAEELALRRNCPGIELRGGALPETGAG